VTVYVGFTAVGQNVFQSDCVSMLLVWQMMFSTLLVDSRNITWMVVTQHEICLLLISDFVSGPKLVHVHSFFTTMFLVAVTNCHVVVIFAVSSELKSDL